MYAAYGAVEDGNQKFWKAQNRTKWCETIF